MEAFVKTFVQDANLRRNCMLEWGARAIARDVADGLVTPDMVAFIRAFEDSPRVLDHTVHWDLPRADWLLNE